MNFKTLHLLGVTYIYIMISIRHSPPMLLQRNKSKLQKTSESIYVLNVMYIVVFFKELFYSGLIAWLSLMALV